MIPLEGWKPKLPELRSDTLANFRKRNEVRVPIRLSEVDGRPVHLLTDSDLAELFRQERDVDSNWKSFYLRFPDAAGLIGLSRIGLSENGGQALVYLSFSFGSLAGHGALFLLERRSGRWRIVAEHVVWVS